MSDKTTIEWTDATWNPVRGCVKVSAGCKNCYAETFAERWRGIQGHPYEQGFDLRLVPEKLTEPLKWKAPRRVFVNSMSDLFQDGVPFEYIDKVFAVMALAPQHTFQVLTKRPELMREYMQSRSKSADFWKQAVPSGWSLQWQDYSLVPFPLPNVWLGISAENQKALDERASDLIRTPAAVRFVSYEPALGPLFGLSQWLYPWSDNRPQYSGSGRGIDWVIAGAESGPKARPAEMEWFRSVRDQCRDAGTAFFLKQFASNGKKIHTPELDGERWVQYPAKVLQF